VQLLVTSPRSDDTAILKSLVFTTLGRLERGDESVAAVLLSNDSLFGSALVSHMPSQSMLSTALLRELSRSAQARSQLDHSFKLQNGLGMTTNGHGPFALQSLLSHSEKVGEKDDLSEFLLPVGKLWLWQLISGSVVHSVSKEGYEYAEDEASVVLSASLLLIDELEGLDEACTCCYARQLQIGAKAYYLMNLCLQPERILCSDRIVPLAQKLLDKYVLRVDTGFVLALSHICLMHSSSKQLLKGNKPGDKMSTDEQKIAAILDGADPTDSILSKEKLRALVDFVGDMCDIYIDYGAQYAFVTKCLRLFLLPVFPTKIRCEILRRLRGLLHLFNIEGEDISALLERSLSNDRQTSDGFIQETPEFLDAIASVVSRGSGHRADGGFVSSLAVAVLARSLVLSLQTGSPSLGTSKRRLQSLEESIASRTIQATAICLSSNGTVSDLVNTVVYEGASRDDEGFPVDLTKSLFDDVSWNHLIASLRGRLRWTS
jgi:hypothetical protein